jgi:hypothetical protein
MLYNAVIYRNIKKGKHTNAKQCTEERKAPMVKLPSRTPTRSIQEVEQKAGKVHTSIAQ